MNKHNKLFPGGSFTVGINQFSDERRPFTGLFQPGYEKAFKNQPIFNASLANNDFYQANNKTWTQYKIRFNKNYTQEEESLK